MFLRDLLRNSDGSYYADYGIEICNRVNNAGHLWLKGYTYYKNGWEAGHHDFDGSTSLACDDTLRITVDENGNLVSSVIL